MRKLIGLKKAVEDYKKYSRQCGVNEFAVLLLNTDTGELWAGLLEDSPDVDRYDIIYNEAAINACSVDWIDYHLSMLSEIEETEYKINEENVKMFCRNYVSWGE